MNSKFFFLIFLFFPALLIASPPTPRKLVKIPFENERINHDCIFCKDSHDALWFYYDLTGSKKIVCDLKNLAGGGFIYVDNNQVVQTPNNYISNQVTFTNQGQTTNNQFHVDKIANLEINDLESNQNSFASCHYEKDETS